MEQTLIVGVDVSKSTLDICFKPAQTLLQIPNTSPGFKELMVAICEQSQLMEAPKLLVIMEHTGLYSRRFEKFLQVHHIGFCKISALQIKRSLGAIRGKNDKIDAVRIAEYGWLRKDILQADELLQDYIEELHSLLSYRNKLVRNQSGLLSRHNEIMSAGIKRSSFLATHQAKVIRQCKKDIAEVDKQIKQLILRHTALQNTSELLQSIKGVGWIVAAYMIAYTRNFKKFGSARKFNCYAGIAPFEHSSGSSLRSRPRVSHLANKNIKRLLNLSAFSAIRYNPELRDYYQRRRKEGKRGMSCINIIRAKIVHRMFAIIKRQTPYQPIPVNPNPFEN